MKLIVAFITLCCCLQVLGQDKFPDGKLTGSGIMRA